MKYKQLAEEAEKELKERAKEIEFLKLQLNTYEQQFAEHMVEFIPSEEAKEILRLFASKAGNKHELVLLVRALAKLPA